MTKNNILPFDAEKAVLLGRAFIPELLGPSVIAVRDGEAFDITAKGAATSSAILDLKDPIRYVDKAILRATSLGGIEEICRNSEEGTRDWERPWLLSPVDLQAVKAAGVTFIVSLLERVIEEKARGEVKLAQEIRTAIVDLVGGELSLLKPGSKKASDVKKLLIERGIWSQYLEVGIGEDAEIFTKCQPLSSVGFGSNIGILRNSTWNNPEPEIVLIISSFGKIVGATLGNDLNLRDLEGRSALLLSKAKDNNASAALGPFIRLFDNNFTLDEIRGAEIKVQVLGEDNYKLEGVSSMKEISRDPMDLVNQTINRNHQYPDGFALFLGTMFAPIEDRDVIGEGFTHKIDDLVSISTKKLGVLENKVKFCSDCAPWSFGVGALIKNLSVRGLC